MLGDQLAHHGPLASNAGQAKNVQQVAAVQHYGAMHLLIYIYVYIYDIHTVSCVELYNHTWYRPFFSKAHGWTCVVRV